MLDTVPLDEVQIQTGYSICQADFIKLGAQGSELGIMQLSVNGRKYDE